MIFVLVIIFVDIYFLVDTDPGDSLYFWLTI